MFRDYRTGIRDGQSVQHLFWQPSSVHHTVAIGIHRELRHNVILPLMASAGVASLTGDIEEKWVVR